jgi:hypothetical protein
MMAQIKIAAPNLAQVSHHGGVDLFATGLSGIMSSARQCDYLHELAPLVSKHDRRLIMMVLYYGMSHAQIARQTGVSVALIRFRLVRVLARLAGLDTIDGKQR